MPSKEQKKAQPPVLPDSKIGVTQWKADDRTISRSFPGPRGASALLRVAVDRAAYAELIAHAKGSLDREICGVLVGNTCEDDQGVFVYVAAIIRGTATSQGSTHVTFTQETWNHIHSTLEKSYPKLQMVGWYHSHPGFGVEFSDMDLFIQRNFFTGPTQIALVMDPLSGAVAICLNTPSGIQYLDKFWVDGREQPCQIPKDHTPQSSASGATTETVSEESIRLLETRLSQLIQVVDEQRLSYQRLLFFIGISACFALIAGVGYSVYSAYHYRNDPPKMNQFVPVPVKVGDKNVLLGVAIAEWQVPDELNATFIELEKMKRAEEAKKSKTDTNATPAKPTP